MSFTIDIKNHVEAATGLEAYPFHVPQTATLPALLYDKLTVNRHDDSNLDSSNIKSQRFQFNVVAEDSGDALTYGEQIISLYEGFSGTIGTTEIMIARVASSTPLYSSTRQTFEYAVDVIFTTLN